MTNRFLPVTDLFLVVTKRFLLMTWHFWVITKRFLMILSHFWRLLEVLGMDPRLRGNDSQNPKS